MRLAIVGDISDGSAVPGGNRGCYDIASLASALAGKGHDVRVYTASTAHAATGDYEMIRLPVESSTDGHLESSMPSIGHIGQLLVDDWSDRPLDMVHCHGGVHGMASQLAANRRPVPTVQSFHGLGTLMRMPNDEQKSVTTRITLQTLLARNATTVAAACTDDLAELVRFGCPRRKIVVVPAGITVDESTAAETSGAQGDNRVHVVAVATGPDRHERLVEVIRTMPALPRADLRIIDDAGCGHCDIDQLSAEADALGVGDRCRVVTVADQKALSTVFRSADVVVCPEFYDAYGTIALQAMASGAAVIAAAAGGMRDAVIPDVTGVLVPPGDVDALRHALRTMLRQPVLSEGMGLAGRSRARSRYSWDRVAVDAEMAYRDAAERHNIAGRRTAV